MIPLTLALHYRERAQHAAAGWLVPGDDPRAWLDEWQRWGISQSGWRIAVFPGWGALAILPAGVVPKVTPAAVPLGCMGSRLYLPIEAELLPAVTADEIDDLLPASVAVAVFHPQRGLLSIAEEQLLRVSDLFIAQSPRTKDWNLAQPGRFINERLVSVHPAVPPTAQDVLDDAKGDIGSSAQEIAGLPKLPDEPGSDVASQAGRAARRGLAGAIQSIAKALEKLLPKSRPAAGNRAKPPTPSTAANTAGMPARGGWLQGLARFAENLNAGVTKQLDALRHRELLRLMRMLETNPDEGLKYALPLAGSGERGRAAPGSRLGERNVNFQLSMFGGGQPADPWDLSAQHRARLSLQYRELANRELQLGRYRRAAYILAQLLGDLPAAAAALKSGGHFREAAVLYRDKLNQPGEAAKCLEQGGLLHEAIELYQTLREYEKVGDLYHRLEEETLAAEHWQQAIAVCETRRDYLDAARIAEAKLKQDEQTLEILARGWPHTLQARACLTRSLQLLGRRGRHEETRARIKQLRANPLLPPVAIHAVEALAEVAKGYPDQAVTGLAADTLRVIAAEHLPDVEHGVRHRMLNAVEQLVPADRLLRQDCQRYHDQRLALSPPPSVQLATARLPSRRPREIRRFQLPADTVWLCAIATGGVFYALGEKEGEYVLLRGLWNGTLQHGGSSPRVPNSARPFLAKENQGSGPLCVGAELTKRRPKWSFPSDEFFPALKIENISSTAEGRLLGMAFAHHQKYVLYERRGLLTACCMSTEHGEDVAGDSLLDTFAWATQFEEKNPLPLHGRPGLLAVGRGRPLDFTGSVRNQPIEFPDPIVQITGSAPFTRTRLAVVTEQAGYVVWFDGGTALEPPEKFTETLILPQCCFTNAGLLVAMAENGGEIYDTSGGVLTFRAECEPLGVAPMAVLPTDRGDEYAVFFETGEVRVMQVP